MVILVDSSVLVAAEKGDLDLEETLEPYRGDSFRIAAITVSEILHGVHRADSARRRSVRLEFVKSILERFPTLAFDLDVARKHSALWADLEREGVRIPAHDLLIAATAFHFDAAVATRDKRSFPRIPDLEVLLWT